MRSTSSRYSSLPNKPQINPFSAAPAALSSTADGAHAAGDETWIAVARLLRPQGRKGELLADPLTDLPEVFVKGASFRLAHRASDAASAPVLTLEDCWRPQGRNAGRLVLKLTGINSITAAEQVQLQELWFPAADLPALDADTYLVRDLVGCALLDGEEELGTITALQFPVGPDGRTRLPDAVDLLVVQPSGRSADAEPVLVPFVKAWLGHVDLGARRLVMHLPPGLFAPDDAEDEHPL